MIWKDRLGLEERLGDVDVELLIDALDDIRPGRTEHWGLEVRHADEARIPAMNLIILGEPHR